MRDDRKVACVGTIGHIDHGRATLPHLLSSVVWASPTVGKVLEEMAVEDATKVEKLALQLEPYQRGLVEPEVDVYGPNQGRLRSRDRKMSKKAKLRDLQRRAFLGE